MTAKKGTLARLLVDQFDFSSDNAGFTVTVAMSEQERTTLQATAMAYEPILPSMKIEHNGYLMGAGAAGDMEQELQARLGVSGVYVAAILGTDEAAPVAYVLDNTFGATMNIQSPATGLITLNGAWGMGGGGHRGIQIYRGTISATGNQAAVDLGSAGSSGGEAYLFVTAISGAATNAQIKVQSSATEGGVYADEATFTFSSVDGYMQALSGTIDRWLRLNTASMGGATSFDVMLIVAVKGVTE